MQCLHAGVDDDAHGMSRWLPAGKRAAVCFNVDDVHPATSQDEFDAGGDLGRGALGRVERLLDRQPGCGSRSCHTRLASEAPRSDPQVAYQDPLVRERVHWLH